MANKFKVGDLVRHVHWDLYGIVVPSDNYYNWVRVMWTRGDHEKPPKGICWMMKEERVSWNSTPFPTCKVAKHWIKLAQTEE